MGILVKAEVLVMQAVFVVTIEWPVLSKTRRLGAGSHAEPSAALAMLSLSG